MKRERVLGIFILGLLVVSLLAGVVSAQENPVAQWFSENFTETFNSWSEGEGVGGLLAKVLLFIIVLVIIQSVITKVPPFKEEEQQTFGWVISIIVAFLSTAYLTPDDVYAILLSYSGLGVVLAAILPFIILTVFSYDILAHNAIKNAWVRVWIVRLMWGILAVWVWYRYFTFDAASDNAVGYSPYIFLLVGLISIVAIVFASYITKVVRTGEQQGTIEGMEDTIKLSTAKTKADANAAKDLGAGI